MGLWHNENKVAGAVQTQHCFDTAFEKRFLPQLDECFRNTCSEPFATACSDEYYAKSMRAVQGRCFR